MTISPKRPGKQLNWSKRSITDREKIAQFYKEEASLFIAIEADKAIVGAATKIRNHPLAYRGGKKPGTREYVMRRFPYILMYRVTATKISIVRVLHQSLHFFN